MSQGYFHKIGNNDVIDRMCFKRINFETRGDESKIVFAPYTRVVSELFWASSELRVVNIYLRSLFHDLRRKCREIVLWPIYGVCGLGLRDNYFWWRGAGSKTVIASNTRVVSEILWASSKLLSPFAILCSQTQMPRNRNMANIWSVRTGFEGLLLRKEGRWKQNCFRPIY